MKEISGDAEMLVQVYPFSELPDKATFCDVGWVGVRNDVRTIMLTYITGVVWVTYVSRYSRRTPIFTRHYKINLLSLCRASR